LSRSACWSALDDGDGAAQTLSVANLPNDAEFIAWGTFGGGTVKLQQSHDGGTTWIDLASLPAAGRTVVRLTHAGRVRASLSGRHRAEPDCQARRRERPDHHLPI
jgi:hypothetical protein